MDDIVERLRRRVESWEQDGELAPDCIDAQWDYQAANEIERLRAEIKRLSSVVVLCPRCMEADRG